MRKDLTSFVPVVPVSRDRGPLTRARTRRDLSIYIYILCILKKRDNRDKWK